MDEINKLFYFLFSENCTCILKYTTFDIHCALFSHFDEEFSWIL